MDIYSIELAAERIDDSRTREYFGEVLSSYINGNYRSAVVMLWSVIVCDLVYKLQRLREIYNDATAEDILEEVARQQEANPRSPDWELYLLEEVCKRTELIDNAEYDSLEHIQTQRHLAAHPILSNDDLLFSPNRDTVRALMRNSLDSVLLKPPVLSRKITSDLVVDLASKRDLFVDDDAFRRYLHAKYLKNLHAAAENKLFRDLWKFVFRLDNEQADENRVINYRALCTIFDRRRAELRAFISTQPDYFSEVGGEPKQMRYLVDFLVKHPLVFELLTPAAVAQLESFADQDIAAFASATFLSDGICSHLVELDDRVAKAGSFYLDDDPSYPEEEVWDRLETLSTEAGCLSQLLDVAIALHAHSGNFDAANNSFTRFIQPYLQEFSETQLETLLASIEGNNQTYWRRRARADYEDLFLRCQAVLPDDFDYERFPHFYDLISHMIELEEEEDIPF